MMTFKRILLTYGVLALLTGLFIFFDVLHINMQLDTVTATVCDVTVQTYSYRPTRKSETVQQMMYVPEAEYTYKGEYHTSPVTSYYAEGMSPKEALSLNEGDTAVLYVDPKTGHTKASASYMIAIVQTFIAAVMILVGRRGAEKYRAEFIKRYPIAFLLTCAETAIVLIYAIFEEFLYVAPTGGFMPGMEAIGVFVLLFTLILLALITQITAWTVLLVADKIQKRKSNEQ